MGTSILLVDDADLEYTIKVLEMRGKYFVNQYTDVESAVEAINGGLKYDIAVFDIEFGDGTIEDLIAASQKANPGVPMVAFSGYYYAGPHQVYHVHKTLGFKGIMDAIETLIKAK